MGLGSWDEPCNQFLVEFVGGVIKILLVFVVLLEVFDKEGLKFDI